MRSQKSAVSSQKIKKQKRSLLQLIIAGFGGQGILFTGRVLAQSAMIEGKHVTWFPSYGAEIRGGTAHCTVIISDEMIGSPLVRHPNALIIMNQASLKRFTPLLGQGGLLLMNFSLIKDYPDPSGIEKITIKATDIAEELGSSQIANMVMLGAFVARTGIVKMDTIYYALKEIVPEHRKNLIHLNEQAFTKGFKEIAGKKGKH